MIEVAITRYRNKDKDLTVDLVEAIAVFNKQEGQHLKVHTDYLEMLGLSKRLDAEDIRRLWQPRGEIDFLRVPLGPDDRGKPMMLQSK